MRHLKLFFLVALAVLITAQPVLHHHSLGSEGATPACSVCAFGADARVHAPAIAAPLELPFTFASVVDTATPAEVLRATSARAPPAERA